MLISGERRRPLSSSRSPLTAMSRAHSPRPAATGVPHRAIVKSARPAPCAAGAEDRRLRRAGVASSISRLRHRSALRLASVFAATAKAAATHLVAQRLPRVRVARCCRWSASGRSTRGRKHSAFICFAASPRQVSASARASLSSVGIVPRSEQQPQLSNSQFMILQSP